LYTSNSFRLLSQDLEQFLCEWLSRTRILTCEQFSVCYNARLPLFCRLLIIASQLLDLGLQQKWYFLYTSNRFLLIIGEPCDFLSSKNGLSILFVFTSADETLTGDKTGYWLTEAAHPYYVLSPKFEIDFASPKKTFPVDPNSIAAATDGKDQQALGFEKDETVKAKQRAAKSLTEVNPQDYVAIFFVGGHGPVVDLASDPNCAKLVEAFWAQDKYVMAVCHGPAALVGAQKDGKSIFAGKKVTGFSNDEEEAVGRVKEVPFLLETKIKELGGNYEKAAKQWEPCVVADGKLLTGQNPSSAEPLAKKLLEVLG